MTSKLKRTIGIIVCIKEQAKMPPFAEASYYAQLAKIAKMYELEVLVFNPKQINWTNRKVPAWYIQAGRWVREIFNLPLVIYDRCYYTSTSHFQTYRPYILRIHHDPKVQFLGRALGGKYQTYQMLKQDETIAHFLPDTQLYDRPASLLAKLKEHKHICIKPNGGSHGIGVVSIRYQADRFLLKGRTKANTLFEKKLQSEAHLRSWLQSFIQDNRYLIQPFLPLSTPDGRPFDLRILVQKNGNQTWETTGMAIRIGKENSITSNLHGGGNAIKCDDFLQNNYAEQNIPHIKTQIEQLATIVPPHIEKHHGQLVELGLDVGIDREGKVWIIEVNSKPGRSVFLRTGELETRKRSMELPVQYANALLSQQVGGS
jgi:glutathione synthase/RimK-type ligase-like ATP-grasp enzyme